MDPCDIYNKEIDKQARRLKHKARDFTRCLVFVALIIMACVVALIVTFACV